MENCRRQMLTAVRRGKPIRLVAREFHVSQPTVQPWVDRAKGQRLDRVCWADRSSAPRRVANRVSAKVEQMMLSLRRRLQEHGDLGEFGAAAIQRELPRRGATPLPAVRTLRRILARGGALDYRSRVRRPPPPLGWYLPEVAKGEAELDQFDFVEGLVIRGGIEVEVLNGISLHGGLAGSWPASPYDPESAIGAMLEHWREFGLPAYARFDNDDLFQGSHRPCDAIGKVIRLCLRLDVVAVFAPPERMEVLALVMILRF